MTEPVYWLNDRPADGALDGIARGIVLELCRQEGIEAVEGSLTPDDVHTADECLLCGTGAELLPMRSVDGRQMVRSPGPMTGNTQDAFHKLIEKETRRQG